MNDVVQATRRRKLLSLPAALQNESLLLYVPRHVLTEVERNLPGYCVRLKSPVDPVDAEACWNTFYLPHLRVVDVPEHWGAEDPDVQAVAGQHPTDSPTARLAAALADCYVLARDGDLTDNHFGKHEHLDLLHAAANIGEKNHIDQMAALPVAMGIVLTDVVVRGFGRLPGFVQIGTALSLGYVVARWHRSGKARKTVRALSDFADDLVSVIRPPLEQLHQRLREAEAVWTEHVVPHRAGVSASEQVARILAFSPDGGLLAREIAGRIDLPGTIKERTAVVRTVLEESDAFVEIRPWRWRLGHEVSNSGPCLPPDVVAEWLARTPNTFAIPKLLETAAIPVSRHQASIEVSSIRNGA